MKRKDVARIRGNLQSEIDSAALYDALGEAESSAQLAEVYHRMAKIEEHHAHFWEQQLRSGGVAVPEMRPSWRSRTLAWLAKRFGAGFVLPTLMGMESADSGSYGNQPESRATRMPFEERSHRRLLSAIAGTGKGGGMEGASIARLEGRHRGVAGNALRAAVLGSNDGLVSNLSLVMGVAGAALSNHAILLTGFAGLLAGAISMALGEWLSVQSSRELYERQIQVEAEELREMPEEEEMELTLIYQAKGLPEEEAKAVAARLIADNENALDTLAREELGIDPEKLGGSAWVAALTSFLLFAGGAIVPVVPFIFISGAQATLVSLVLSAAGLFVIGAGVSLMTGKGLLSSGARQMVFGLVAAAVTWGIGHLMGAVMGG